MTSTHRTLEEVYANLSLEEGDEGAVLVEAEEGNPVRQSFVLVGRFLTDKNVNFQAMQNVLAALWRPKEGVEIHDLGGQRYSFVFFHILDLQKVIDGGPWTFEQSLLILHKLEVMEDPHMVPLNSMNIWVQVYDLPQGMITEKIMQSIGNSVGMFVKTDPMNVNGGWKQYIRIRVTMDVNKPLKRRMKLKREGGAWNWINFKYERLSMFCFVCGLLGHSDRDCSVVYAHPDKIVERAYGVGLRAPNKNVKVQNIGAKWLRNGTEGGQAWQSDGKTGGTSSGQGWEMEAEFREEGGVVSEIPGRLDVISVTNRGIRESGNQGGFQNLNNMELMEGVDDTVINDLVVMDSKRKRIEMEKNEEIILENMSVVNKEFIDGPKNGLEAGPGAQARLSQ